MVYEITVLEFIKFRTPYTVQLHGGPGTAGGWIGSENSGITPGALTPK